MKTTRMYSVIVAGALAASAFALAPVAQASPVGLGNGTVKARTQVTTGPSLARVTGWLNPGQHVDLTCFSYGQNVQGFFGWRNLWYRTAGPGWVADADIETGVNGPIPKMPHC